MSPDQEITHVAFADESNWNQKQFRSISLVSASKQAAAQFQRELNILRKKHRKSEYKWGKPKKEHGIDLVDFLFRNINRIRVDVIIWDIEDSRHKGLRKRDDKENFARMYYHLLHFVLEKCWPDGANWFIYPDEQKEIDWNTLEKCLGWKSWAIEENMFTVCGEMSGFRDFYNIREICCVSSKDYLLVQLADLFAGLAAYSHSAFQKYQQWESDHDSTHDFFNNVDFETKKRSLSNSDKERLPILHHLRQKCRSEKLSTSLNKKKGLYTFRKSEHLNFWLYTPQHPHDKAPIKHVN